MAYPVHRRAAIGASTSLCTDVFYVIRYITVQSLTVIVTYNLAGIAAVLPVDWLTTAAVDTGMKEEFPTWRAKDALLDASLSVLDKFYWQSHSLSHLARDNLGVIDCKIEDYGEYGRTSLV